MAESAARSSAVLLTTGPDTGLAWHYGDPLGEQRRLEHGDAVVDLSNREVVTVTGPAGAVRWYWAEPGGGAALVARLGVEQTAGVSVELRPDVAVVWLAVGVESEPGLIGANCDGRGESNGVAAGRLKGDEASDPVTGTAVSDLVVRPGALAQQKAHPGGWDVFLPRDLVSTALTWFSPAGLWAYEAFRIAAGGWRVGPGLDVDVDDSGCLYRLHLDGSAETWLPVGTPLLTQTDPPANVGRLGTMAYHWQLGPIAWGLITVDEPLPDQLVAGGVACAVDATVPVTVFPGAG